METDQNEHADVVPRDNVDNSNGKNIKLFLHALEYIFIGGFRTYLFG